MPWLWSTAAASGTNVAFTRKKAPFFWVDHILGHWLGHLQWQGCFHSLAPVSSLSFQICALKWSRGSPYSPLPRQPGSSSTNQRWSAFWSMSWIRTFALFQANPALLRNSCLPKWPGPLHARSSRERMARARSLLTSSSPGLLEPRQEVG